MQDRFNREIAVGDFVVAAKSINRSSDLVMGVVKKITNSTITIVHPSSHFNDHTPMVNSNNAYRQSLVNRILNDKPNQYDSKRDIKLIKRHGLNITLEQFYGWHKNTTLSPELHVHSVS